uniref:Uncharacterized protein n=1 Tax=Arundo donax TaxID=35708 RepID=A0A0A9CIJ5_ARUDO
MKRWMSTASVWCSWSSQPARRPMTVASTVAWPSGQSVNLIRGEHPEATDKHIRYAGYPGEIETVFRLSVKCTSNSLSSRPTMKDVLQILLKCSKQTLQKSRMEYGTE